MSSDPRRWLRYAFAAAIAVPLTTFAHECGHALAARSVGFRAVAIHALSVSYQAGPGREWERVLVAAAGPLVTAGLVGLGALVLLRGASGPLALATVAAAPLRNFASVLYLLWAPLGSPRVRPSDEWALAVLTGVPLWAFALAGACVLVGAALVVVVTMRAAPKASRDAAVKGLSIGLGVGWAAQLTVIPRVLP